MKGIPVTVATPISTTDDPPQHVQQTRAFHVHATVFAVSMVMIFLANLGINAVAGIAGEWWAWWSVLALLGWGTGVTVHGLVVRLSRPQSRETRRLGR